MRAEVGLDQPLFKLVGLGLVQRLPGDEDLGDLLAHLLGRAREAGRELLEPAAFGFGHDRASSGRLARRHAPLQGSRPWTASPPLSPSWTTPPSPCSARPARWRRPRASTTSSPSASS